MDIIQEAKRLFNETWDLLDKKDRTSEDDITMLHKAHTSCLLWRTAKSPVNDARGDWQVSHVYSVLRMGAPALLHAQRSLSLCLTNGVAGLDLAFGYEAVARAYAVLGEEKEAVNYRSLGITACEGIEKDSDKQYALKELADAL